MPETFSRIAAIIATELTRARAPATCPEIQPATTLEGDLGLTTIDLVCISIEIEDAFAVELPADRLEACDSVADLARLVSELPESRGLQ